MPTTPTVQPALLPVPAGPGVDATTVPILALDLGIDAPELAQLGAGLSRLRAAAIEELRQLGLHTVTPADIVPPAATGPGWDAALAPGHLELRTAERVVFDGELAAWPAYTDAVQTTGWALLYAGHLALGWGADGMHAIRQAADRGEVCGGIVPARWTPAS